MQKGRVDRLVASALLALMVAAPTQASAQEQVVVPIPPSFINQSSVRKDDLPAPRPLAPAVVVPIPQAAATEPPPASKSEPEAAAIVPPPASVPEPKAVAAVPPPSPKEQRAVRQNVPMPRPTPAANVPQAKAAAAVPLPPVRTKRAAVHHDAVPLPRPAPPAVNAPTLKAAAAEPAPAREPAVAAPQPAEESNIDRKAAIDTALEGADAQIADKLRDIITDKRFGKRIARATDRHAIEAFYGARNYAPLWIHDGEFTARAKAAIARLQDAAADGLDTSGYPVPKLGSNAPAALANDDITLTSSVLTFARHLATGRIAPSRVFEQVDYGNHTPQPADVLKTVADADNVNAAFDSFNPQHRGFQALKRELAALRAHASVGKPHAPIPGGRAIIPGHKDDRVPMLRARLGLKGKRDDTAYDGALLKAVQALQAHNGIRDSGIVGPKTLAVLNQRKAERTDGVIDRVLANMERWRWLPRDLGRTYVMVNVPDYTLKVVNRHRVMWRTKIVAGKVETPSPLATATMDSVIVNPSWHVPQSIIENELLPRYQYDPNIFERMGLEVKRGRDGNISVVQPPGAANALGRIKFNFPNKFQVYLHDTPAKNLFKNSRRAFSHGCMRVQDPTIFGEIVLRLAMNRASPNSHQLQAMFGSEEHVFKLSDRPKVHLTYQTAFVDDAGKLHLRDDVYGFDARTIDIMHGRAPRSADKASAAAPKRDLATFKSNQDMLRQVERRETSSLFSVERREALNPFRVIEDIFR